MLKEHTIIKRETHLRLMTKDRQNLLKEDTIIKTETHLGLMSEDRQNLLKEETIIKGRKTNNMQPVTVQAPCSSSEFDCTSSTNTSTNKNQYLREFDADKNGKIHIQD